MFTKIQLPEGHASHIIKRHRIRLGQAPPRPQGRAEIEAEIRERLAAQTASAIAAAEERGRRAGRREAEAEMRAEIEQSSKRLARRERKLREEMERQSEAVKGLLKAHTAAIQEEIQQLWSDVGEITLSIAAGVVRWTVDHDPELIGRVMVACVEEIAEPTKSLRAQVHPLDLRTLREIGVEQLAGFDLELVANPAIKRGGCLLEAGERILDGRLQRQLERLGEALAEAIVATEADTLPPPPNTDSSGEPGANAVTADSPEVEA